MDDNLRAFLEKFAELERRVRKLAAEDRALRDEASELRERLARAQIEASELREQVDRERDARARARDRIDSLLDRLGAIKAGAESSGPESLDDGEQGRVSDGRGAAAMGSGAREQREGQE